MLQYSCLLFLTLQYIRNKRIRKCKGLLRKAVEEGGGNEIRFFTLNQNSEKNQTQNTFSSWGRNGDADVGERTCGHSEAGREWDE